MNWPRVIPRLFWNYDYNSMLTNIRNLEKRRTSDCLTGAGCSYLFALLRSWRIAVLSSSSCCSPEAGQRVQQVLSQLDLASCAGCSYLFALLRRWRIAVPSPRCCCRLAGGRVTERQVGPGIQRSACGWTAAPVLATMDPRLPCGLSVSGFLQLCVHLSHGCCQIATRSSCCRQQRRPRKTTSAKAITGSLPIFLEQAIQYWIAGHCLAAQLLLRLEET